MNQPAESGDIRSDLPLVRPVVAGSERLSLTGGAFPELAPPLRVSPAGGRPAPAPDQDAATPIAPAAPEPETMADIEPDAGGQDDDEGAFEELPWLITDHTPHPSPPAEPIGEAFDTDWGAPWDEQETGGEAPAEPGTPHHSDGPPLVTPEAGAPFELYQEAQGSVPTAAAPQAGAGPGAERSRAEHMADRLDAIARLLRERGPTGPLASGDPLGALITGYLLGSTESKGTTGAAE